MVYVVNDPQFRFDGDLFRYGQYWFAYCGGYWYRAREYRGPYLAMDVRKIPRAIPGVPRARWKHHPQATPGRAIGRGAATASTSVTARAPSGRRGRGKPRRSGC